MHNAACGGLGLGLGLRVRVRVRVRVREAPGSKSSSHLVAESRLARSTRNVSPNAMISCDVRNARRRKICSALPPPGAGRLEGEAQWTPGSFASTAHESQNSTEIPPAEQCRASVRRAAEVHSASVERLDCGIPISVGANFLGGVSHSRSSRTCAERERDAAFVGTRNAPTLSHRTSDARLTVVCIL